MRSDFGKLTVFIAFTKQMKPMKQLSVAEIGFLPKAGKQTRKAIFLFEMEMVVSWPRLEALIDPFYPKKCNGRPAMPLGTMLRIHFTRQWLGYSDQRWKKPRTMFPCCVNSLVLKLEISIRLATMPSRDMMSKILANCQLYSC
jgi:hypothetical protein